MSRPLSPAPPPADTAAPTARDPWADVPRQLRDRGLRWTPQRRLLIDVLSGIEGHVTGAELVDRCRAVDQATIPSTVYRTLDVLEEIGLVRHCHGANGHEEYHVRPGMEHGHLYCEGCGHMIEIGAADVADVARLFRERHAFDIDPSHITIVGLCAGCAHPGTAGKG